MQVILLRNLGTRDWPGYEAYKIGDTVTVSDEDGKKLIGRGLAEAVTIKGVPPAAAIKGVPPAEEESPVADENAHEAIDEIKRMRSKDKLNEIIATDQRVTVVEAAKKRLVEIG